jgi:hypothetical protein
MATLRRKPTDEQLLEGGGGGGGGGGFGGSPTLMPKLNRPAKEGFQYRSPEQTNARSMTPHPMEDVMGSQRADIGRIGRGLNASGVTPRGRAMQQEAAGRAITRTLGRAGALGAVGLGGAEIGKKLAGKGMESSGEEMSQMSERPAPKAAPKAALKTPTPRGVVEMPQSSIREGENERIDEDTRRRAMQSVEGMKRGGKVKKYDGGGSIDYKTPEDVKEEKYLKKATNAYDKAMPEADTTFGKLKGKTASQNKFGAHSTQAPKFTSAETEGGASLMYRKRMKAGGSVSSASSRADGIAQRGKTKGRFV